MIKDFRTVQTKGKPMRLSSMSLGSAAALVFLTSPRFDNGFYYRDLSGAFTSTEISNLQSVFSNNGFAVMVSGRSAAKGVGSKYMITELGYRAAPKIEKLLSSVWGV